MPHFQKQTSHTERTTFPSVEGSMVPCAACHLPAGTAGIPLASLGDWQAKKVQIQQRVFDLNSDKPMPPANATTTLSDAEKTALQCWLGTQR